MYPSFTRLYRRPFSTSLEMMKINQSWVAGETESTKWAGITITQNNKTKQRPTFKRSSWDVSIWSAYSRSVSKCSSSPEFMSYNAMLMCLNMAEPMALPLAVSAKWNCSVILDVLSLFVVIYRHFKGTFLASLIIFVWFLLRLRLHV